MCGIVGIVSKSRTKIAKKLTNNLCFLEYRGYDSAGLAVLQKNNILVEKGIDSISFLSSTTKDILGKVGIAHTRWATHGKVCKENAHPFLSPSKNFAIVHNGIIENSEQLKRKYELKNFSSSTDSEVVCHLLDKFQNLSPLNAFLKVCNLLKGSFAIACESVYLKNSLLVCKNKSPLFVFCGENESGVSSDPVCFLNKKGKIFKLNDGEVCVVSFNNLQFFNFKGENIAKTPTIFKEKQNSTKKEKYQHFMLKEILEEPKCVEKILKTYNSEFLKVFDKKFVEKFNKIVFLGCGSAFHVGLMGAKFVERELKIPSVCLVASEFRYSNFVYDKHTLFILVSQSGETADTLGALSLIKQHGGVSISLSNVEYSTLAKECSYSLPACAGREVAVASTKAVISQIIVLYSFIKYLSSVKFGEKFEISSQLKILIKELKKIDYESLTKLAENLSKKKNFVFVGRGVDYVCALESSLKLKEVSYLFTSSYPAGELKHGFLATVDKNTVCFVFATEKELFSKTLNCANEILSRGGKVVFVSQFAPNFKPFKEIPVADVGKLTSILSFSIMQFVAYKIGVFKNLNPDKPRNLAKSVTVE